MCCFLVKFSSPESEVPPKKRQKIIDFDNWWIFGELLTVALAFHVIAGILGLCYEAVGSALLKDAVRAVAEGHG